jgi:hypothetical protein
MLEVKFQRSNFRLEGVGYHSITTHRFPRPPASAAEHTTAIQRRTWTGAHSSNLRRVTTIVERPSDGMAYDGSFR